MPTLSASTKEKLAQRTNEGQLHEEVYWVLQMLSFVKKKEQIDKSVINSAISPGCIPLLEYALDYRRDFMNNHLPKAHNKLSKSKNFNGFYDADNLERIHQARAHFDKKRSSERKRPKRRRPDTKPAVLPSGSEGPDRKPGMESVSF